MPALHFYFAQRKVVFESAVDYNAFKSCSKYMQTLLSDADRILEAK